MRHTAIVGLTAALVGPGSIAKTVRIMQTVRTMRTVGTMRTLGGRASRDGEAMGGRRHAAGRALRMRIREQIKVM